MGNTLLSATGAFAEVERALIRERQRKGIGWPSSPAHTMIARKHSRQTSSASCADELVPANRRPRSSANSVSVAKPYTYT